MSADLSPPLKTGSSTKHCLTHTSVARHQNRGLDRILFVDFGYLVQTRSDAAAKTGRRPLVKTMFLRKIRSHCPIYNSIGPHHGLNRQYRAGCLPDNTGHGGAHQKAFHQGLRKNIITPSTARDRPINKRQPILMLL